MELPFDEVWVQSPDGRSLCAIIYGELARLLPNVERLIIPDASHETCNEHPEVCTQALQRFLAKH
ncbi:hypothetical protein BH24DEI1_BH24DEI1_08810 [soil metagenome]